MGRGIKITHPLFEADMRLIHGYHCAVDRFVVWWVHAQKPHVIRPGFVIVSQRLQGFGGKCRAAHGGHSAGCMVPGSSGWATGGTGPRSGSTGRSDGPGTGLEPGGWAESSSVPCIRGSRNIGSDCRKQDFKRHTGTYQRCSRDHAGRDRREVSQKGGANGVCARNTGSGRVFRRRPVCRGYGFNRHILIFSAARSPRHSPKGPAAVSASLHSQAVALLPSALRTLECAASCLA